MKKAYIFDIDGTICDITHRLGDIKDDPKDWTSFYAKAHLDTPITQTLEIASALSKAGYTILLVTGRPEMLVLQTVQWLTNNTDFETNIFFRKDGDYRPDYIIKEEIYNEKIKPNYEIMGVFEDRTSVVNMWRSKGLTCFQVADGNY